MASDYFLIYAEGNIVCIIIFVLLLFHNQRYNTRQEKEIWFNRTMTVHILYFLSDIGWAGILGGKIPNLRPLVVFFNFSNYILLSLIAFAWFMYMAASEDMILSMTRKQRILWMLPMTISTVAIVTAYMIAPYFWISEQGELNSWYYPMMLAAPLFYILSSFVISMRNAARAESREIKKRYRLIGLYPLSVVFFGIVQTVLLDAPLFCFGCTIMMLHFYIQSMQAQISVDSLTRLNNRGQIERYLSQIKYRENMPIYAAMMDVDHFKKINDTFGHAEGDRALVLIAETLKQTVGKIGGAFIGRYGGDEFVLIVHSAEEGIMERAAEVLQSIATKKQEENKLLYNLNLSVGYDRLGAAPDTMENCLKRADEKLYENKRKKGTLRV